MHLSSIGLLVIGLPLIVIGLSNYPLLIFTGLIGMAVFVLYRQPDKKWIWLFFMAGLFGTAGEWYCVYASWTPEGHGLWIYHFPSIFGLDLPLPLWLPLVWGNLFLCFAGLGEWLSPDPTSKSQRWWSETIRYLLVLGLMIYAGILYRLIMVEVLYLVTPFFAAMLLYWTTFRDFSIYFVSAVLGTVGEIMAMHFGLWEYTAAQFQNDFTEWLGITGLPISLAMAWGLSGVFLYRISLKLSGTAPHP